MSVDDLANYVETLRTLDPQNDILQLERLGTDAALRIAPEAETIVATFQRFSDQDWRSLPGPILAAIEGAARETVQAVERAQQLTPETAAQGRDGVEGKLRTALDKAISELFPAEAMLTARRALDTAETTDFAAAVTRLQELEDRATKLTSSLEQAAAEEGVAKASVVFAAAAKRHEDEAATWQTRAIVLAVAIVAWVVSSHWLFHPDEDESTGQAIGLVGTRLAVLSLLGVALAFCVRNVSASRHNAVVNRHREESLKVFDYFLTGVAEDDTETKNAVLLEATRSVFGPQPTGYLKGEDATSTSVPLAVLQNFTDRRQPEA